MTRSPPSLLAVRCARGDSQLQPLLLIVSRACLADLELREDLFDDFVLSDASAEEVEAPSHAPVLAHRPGQEPGSDRLRPTGVEPRDIPGRDPRPSPGSDLHGVRTPTFLAAHPGRVFSRETLLSRVWGYEYFGGARTVDVHVRRLRAKLGEEHAHLIDTVRSVGYRFGSVRWLPSGHGPTRP